MKMFSLRYQVDGQIFILSLYDISSDEQKNRRCNSVVEILVSSLDVITIQIIIDSAPSQLFKAIGTAFACISSYVSVEEYTIRRLVMIHHRPSIVHLNCAVVKVRMKKLYRLDCLMAFARQTLPQIVKSEDPANLLGVARWKGLLHSKLINQYHVLHDRKSGNVMSREEYLRLSTTSKTSAMLLGNTIYYCAGITSKVYPFETSSFSLPFPWYHVQYRVRQLIDIKRKGKELIQNYIPSKEPKLSSFVRGYKRLRSEKFVEETSDGARESWIKVDFLL
ncbi:hypothetical protein V1477_001504 [Vespula maculifrons]|uniref:Uncharacterized protein n=1 Tax=Vespula maculifrons TaxID=7453 RepID=A0ABD2CYS6_VESMC